MKTFENWADRFLNDNHPFIGINQYGIHTNLSQLTKDEKEELFHKLQVENQNKKWGYIQKCFTRFYDEMNIDDMIVIGTGHATCFHVNGIVRVISKPYFTEEVPQHRRSVEIIWKGSPFPVEEWSYAKRLSKLTKEKHLRKFIEIYTIHLNITGTKKRIIAQQSDTRFLVYLGNEQGQILDLHSKILYPAMNIHSILKFGYWEEYTGHHNLDELLKNVRLIETESKNPELNLDNWKNSLEI